MTLDAALAGKQSPLGAALTRPWLLACAWLALLAPLFFITYLGALEIVSWRAHVPTIVYDWERHIPFLAWTVVPYWSIDALFGLSLFLCRDRDELNTHGRRLLTAQLVATAIFLIAPLRLTSTIPDDTGIYEPLFAALRDIVGKPFNLAPSLHIALLVILWAGFVKWITGRWRWLMHIWALLIGMSVLTANQHHFFDVPTGALLGLVCLWLWPDHGRTPLTDWRLTHDRKRRRLCAYYAAAAVLLGASGSMLGGGALWLWWPAVSLAMVALAYLGLGVGLFEKSAEGRRPFAVCLLLAPYTAGARLNARAWQSARDIPVRSRIVDGITLGAMPSRYSIGESVIDMTGELDATADAHWHAYPCLDLVPPAPMSLARAARRIEAERRIGQSVHVCCALGLSRSAAAVATWLLAHGHASSADAAAALIRQARPQIVMAPAVLDAIADAHRLMSEGTA